MRNNSIARVIAVIIMFVSAFFIANGSAKASDNSGSGFTEGYITITVLYDGAATPAEGIQILIEDELQGKTDKNGQIKMGPLSKGEHIIELRDPVSNFNTKTSIFIKQPQNTSLVYFNKPDGTLESGFISIYIVDQNTKLPYEDVQVWTEDEFAGKSDKNGFLRIGPYSVGHHDAVLIHEPSGTEVKNGFFITGAESRTEMWMTLNNKNLEAGYCTIKVINPNTKKVFPDIQVFMEDKLLGKTDSKGSIRLGPYPAGHYDMELFDEASGTREKNGFYITQAESNTVLWFEPQDKSLDSGYITIKVVDQLTKKSYEGIELWMDDTLLGKTSKTGKLRIGPFKAGHHDILLMDKASGTEEMNGFYITKKESATELWFEKDDPNLEEGYITLKVVDQFTKKPFSDVQVWKDKKLVGTTGENGKLRIGPYPPGHHDITLIDEKTGTERNNGFYIRKKESSTEVWFDLNDPNLHEGNITLKVVDHKNKKPLEGIEIYEEDKLLGKTNANGSLKAGPLAAGHHDIEMLDPESGISNLNGFFITSKETKTELWFLYEDKNLKEGYITLEVLDQETKKPLSNIHILMDGAEIGISDEQGLLRAGPYKAGHHDITLVDASNNIKRQNGFYITQQETYTELWFNGEDKNLKEGKIAFTVLYQSTKKPVQNVEIWSDQTLLGKTDQKGYLTAGPFSPGFHNIRLISKEQGIDEFNGFFIEAANNTTTVLIAGGNK